MLSINSEGPPPPMMLKSFTYAMIAVFTSGIATIAVASTNMLMNF